MRHPVSRCADTVLPPVCRPTGRYGAIRNSTERYDRPKLALAFATTTGVLPESLAVLGTVATECPEASGTPALHGG